MYCQQNLWLNANKKIRPHLNQETAVLLLYVDDIAYNTVTVL